LGLRGRSLYHRVRLDIVLTSHPLERLLFLLFPLLPGPREMINVPVLEISPDDWLLNWLM